MKAWLSREAGGPESLHLEEVADPVAGPGQLLVRIHAASLNFPDTLIIADRYQHKPPRPFTPGTDAAGVVEAVGEGVTGFAVGDRVAGLVPTGALAERAVMDEWRAFPIPAEMPYAVAAALIMVYGTTIHALVDRGRLQAGDSLLVLGAAGGTGLSAVQVGKALGARVVAAVSSQAKAEAARAAGADAAIVYPTGPLDKAASRALADQFKAAAPDGYAVVYDPVGGDYVEPALRAIGWEGRYLVIGFTAGIAHLPLNLVLLKACNVVGVFWGAWTMRNRAQSRAEMAQLFAMWQEGRIAPPIGAHFPFALAPQALAALDERRAVGKLIVDVVAPQ
ncbi:NADPH:quinone oxidoreductase family protein [Novosphingobium bradum]|uniref:NADPH:quinone oxidoreductase family protein n=1 Tax=Novosphingobium bradum TaxID=1737444 RepID=A0ABV7IL44_9SPHN